MNIIRYVGKSGCKATAYTQGINGTDSIVINPYERPNVTISFTKDEKPLQINFNPLARDLVDIAAAIYMADELTSRSESPDGWTRDLRFLIPVHNPSLWRKVEDSLVRTVSFLSGDRYTFQWEQRVSIPKPKPHRARLPHSFDTACLFSGGIDSLLGAYSLLREGQKVILVGHQADTITASYQSALADLLRKAFPKQVVLVQCRVARSQAQSPRYQLPEKVDVNHRSRSMLFLSLAAGIASASGVKSIVIPENGLIALNIPLQLSRLGTLSTRTAHPIFIARFRDTVRKLGVFDGSLKNPFLYQSKTDMLKSPSRAIETLLPRTVSCAHPDVPRWAKAKDQRHCGYCVPCIYRRIAMVNCDCYSDSDYIFDVFNQLPSLTPKKQADFRALVQFAKRIKQSSKNSLEFMLLEHGYFPANIGRHIGPYEAKDYSPWSKMLSRWADDFFLKLAANCSAETKAILGI